MIRKLLSRRGTNPDGSKSPSAKKPLKIKPQKPARSYRAVIESLRQVWKIEHVPESNCLWRAGLATIPEISNQVTRIAIWNLCKGAGGRLFEHDYRMVCYRSDIVLTQEALLSERGILTYTEPGFAAIHAASYMRRDGIRDGVMTVSRFHFDEPSMRIVCKYPEPIFQTPKVALVSYFKIAGTDKRLMVINIHATLVRRPEGATEEMLHLVSQLPDHDGPIVFAGDFNTFTTRYLGVVSRVLRRLDLKLVDIANDPRPAIGALDQIYVRGVEVRSAHIDTTVRNSDHFPLFVELAIT